MRPSRWPLLITSVMVSLYVGRASPASPPSLVVFAAASLSDVLQEAGDAYAREFGQTVTLSFAASSALAKQIESGSPADVYLPAETEWMDYLEKRQLVDPSSRRNLLRNRLVMIAPADTPVKLKIAPGFALAAALGEGRRLAIGDPETVPAGRYARYALISLGAWNSVSDRLATAENARAALTFVARGDAPLGVVYETDALKEKRVRVVDVFPASSHPEILYPIALTAKPKAGAARFIDFLRGPESRRIFARYGFKMAQ